MFLVMALATSSRAQAQQKPIQGQKPASTQNEKNVKPKEAPQSKHSSAIDVKIETFRKQIVAGRSIGVAADITNTSASPVYLREEDVQLLVPLEVEMRNQGVTTDGWFPTEKEGRKISLKPGETYRVFWDRSSVDEATNKQSALQRWSWFIRFTPGEYPITVEAKYWDTDDFSKSDYHTFVETKTVEYSAPQSIILLGAILGGLIFTVLSMVRAEQNTTSGTATGKLDKAKGLGKLALVLVGSVLLSVIMTILLSRIGETQFFVKVTVSDFWGAIAIGFLANYGGWKLLDKIIPSQAKTDTGKPPDQAKGASVGAP